MSRLPVKALAAAAVLLLLAAAAGSWFFLRRSASDSQIAVVSYQGEELRRVDLSAVKETETFTVGPEGAQNTIEISPQGIGVIAADCPDQICVSQGIRSHGPEPIVCLPHKLSIRFVGGAEDSPALDAVTGR